MCLRNRDGERRGRYYRANEAAAVSSRLPADSSQVKQQMLILTLLPKARVGPKYPRETKMGIQPLQLRVVLLLQLPPQPSGGIVCAQHNPLALLDTGLSQQPAHCQSAARGRSRRVWAGTGPPQTHVRLCLSTPWHPAASSSRQRAQQQALQIYLCQKLPSTFVSKSSESPSPAEAAPSAPEPPPAPRAP